MWNKIQKIYVGSKQVRPAARTISITRTEQSDMSQSFTYWDDASGRTAWDTRFDEFFGYSLVNLNTSGEVTDEITQSDSGGRGFLNTSLLNSLTGGDNVMIKFPIRWIKMVKSDSTVSLSITTELWAEWYQYYAFNRSWSLQNMFYLGAYMWYSDGGILKSWSWYTPTVSITLPNARTYAKANGSNFSLLWYFQRQYIACLYMMKYGNPDSQSTVWVWYSAQFAAQKTWNTNSNTIWNTMATYWTSSTSQQIKLFWLEDWRWNVFHYVDWVYTDASRYVYIDPSNSYASYPTANITNTHSSSPVEWITTGYNTNFVYAGISHSSNVSWELSWIWGSNYSLFLPTNVVTDSSFNSYYHDSVDVEASRFAVAWGHRSNNPPTGVFNFPLYWAASNVQTVLSWRLMFL